MEHYVVSARKYRPSTFGTVIGQKPLTAALKHAVTTDRLAHAYLFCGSRGVGKTSCARIFAKTINCQNRTPDGEACNECDSCRDFNNGTSLNIIELDAASNNSVEDIRNLIEQVRVPPTNGRYRVFIVDEVHMLSQAAFNSFLKTLEEPPEYVIFILATTEKHKIIPTILSRCQIYDFNRITIQDMVDHLTAVANNEGITTEPAALNVIAKKADGAMRDALSIFDQVAASTMGQVTYHNTIENLNILDNTYYTRLVEAFLANDVPSALLVYKEVRDRGFDSQFFINGLGQYMRDLMVAYTPQTLSLLEAADDVKVELAGIAAKCPPQFVYAAMDLCNTADLNYRAATNKQFLIELTLVKICQLTAPQTTPQPATGLKPIAPAQGAPSAPAIPPAAVRQPATPAPAPQQQTPQPAPQTYQPPTNYRPSTAPRPAQGGVRRSGLPSMSISGNSVEKKDESKADTDEPAQRRSAPYKPEALIEAWNAYANEHPTERILINTMRAALPTLIEGDRYEVSVDDQIQVNTINESRHDILRMLHDRLNNDNVDFVVTLRQGEASPVTWTQREVLQHMVEKHKPLRDMIDDFSFNL